MRRPRFEGLWRHPDFLKLWGAQTVSLFGSQISGLALPLAAILVLDASAFEVAALGMAQMTPFLLFALPAGVWVDRLARRPILVVADLGRAGALLSVPLAYAVDALTIWQLYAVGFVTGTLSVFFEVAYQSYLPSLVDRGQLLEANSKLEVSRSGAQLGGPGVAGLLIGAIKAPYAILVDAISFLASAAFLLVIRREERAPESADGRNMRRELGEGLRYVVRHRYWRPMVVTVASQNFFTSLLFSIFLVYAVRELDLSASMIGLITSLGNVGFLAGALFGSRFSAWFRLGRTIVLSAVLVGAGSLLIPATPQSFPVPTLIAAEAIIGFGVVLYFVNAISLIQTITPERLLGRFNASRRFLNWGTIPLGQLCGGALATQIGLRPTLWVGAIGAMLTVLPVLLSPVRSIESIAEEVAAVETAAV